MVYKPIAPKTNCVCRKLKQMNFDAVSVIESMRGADDEGFMRKAIGEKRVGITNDER